MKERYDNIDEYIRDLQAEIRQNDQCANHYYNLGVALLSKGDFVEAESAFLDAVRNSPHLAEAYIQLGGICMQRGDLEGCLRYNHEAANCRAKGVMQSLRKSLLQFVFSGSSVRRWNDKLRPVELYEEDKQAHKMITAFLL